MNPNCISSTFSVQQVSKHHYLIRGDERVKDYMNFCDVKWSNTYQGWIVHEDDEVDLIQMHMEVMGLAKDQKVRAEKKKAKKAPKKSTKKPSTKKRIISSDEESEVECEDEKPKKTKKSSLYERFKRGEDISDDEDDEYVPSSEPTSETITEESEVDDSEEDSEEDSDDSDEDSDEDSEDSEEECETDSKRKKEYQFYKKGILAFGKMTDRQQEKLEAIWNKTLRGWIIRMSNVEKLKKQGWIEIGHEEPEQKKPEAKKLKEKVIDDSDTVVSTNVVHLPKVSTETVHLPKVSTNLVHLPKVSTNLVHLPKVTKKPKTEEKKTIEKHLFSLLVKGQLSLEQVSKLQAIYHPTLKGFLVSLERRDMLLEMGFTDKDTPVPDVTAPKEKEVVKIDFTQGEQLQA